jgi:hypothetical protein
MRIRRRRDELERRLGSERPQAPDEFVSRLAQSVTPAPIRRRSGWSIALAASFTTLLAVALALTGGIGYAAGAAKNGTTAVTSLVSSSDNPGKSNESSGESDQSSGKSGKSDENTGTSDENTGTSDENAGKSDENAGKSDENSGKSDENSGKSDNSNESGSGSQGGEKQAVCHVPPGNPENAHTIVVSVSAVQTHLDHGDTLGPCPEDPGPPDDQYEEKVFICHIPPGNPENAHTISVSVNAVPAHLAHGDSEGACPEDGNED